MLKRKQIYLSRRTRQKTRIFPSEPRRLRVRCVQREHAPAGARATAQCCTEINPIGISSRPSDFFPSAKDAEERGMEWLAFGQGSLSLLVGRVAVWIGGYYLGPFGLAWVTLSLAIPVVLAVSWMQMCWHWNRPRFPCASSSSPASLSPSPKESGARVPKQ